ncbi:MAG: CHASE2 domain-containing protein [Nostocaceae cyanobacterium]|nr:CHASE2 domain-containing protein [Nostocaceae cyanobacterium]
MLNYHIPKTPLQICSLTDLLVHKIPPELVSDRIVFIGTTDESTKNLFQTPYSHQSSGIPK